jgi:cytidylate kinase
MLPADAEMPLAGSDGSDLINSLREAFARQPRPRSSGRFEPLSLTAAISREAGSRGGTIARRVSRILGWQLYNQELLEYLAQERHLAREIFDGLDAGAGAWVEEELQRLLREQNLSQNNSVVELARLILAIGARGEAVILGRGAGCLLPSKSTLHVRTIAPLADRIAYMSQLERLTPDRAAEQVAIRDEQRASFVHTHFHRQPGDVYQYDLLVNSSLLGEELSAQLIAQAARVKLAGRHHDEGAPPVLVPEPLA